MFGCIDGEGGGSYAVEDVGWVVGFGGWCSLYSFRQVYGLTSALMSKHRNVLSGIRILEIWVRYSLVERGISHGRYPDPVVEVGEIWE